ncbi:helix-turn-helix transcriptional regulator [Burkholderia gladioli]|nr:AraC family transcriptional regulator [Burkholderia gladioli]
MSAEIAISTLLSAIDAEQTTSPGHRLLHARLQDGLDLLIWRGEQPEPLSMNVRDDWGRVQFCCALEGHSSFSFSSGRRSAEFALPAGSACISFAPGCRGRSTHSGRIENVTVSIRRELLAQLAPDIDDALRHELDSERCYMLCRSNAEMRILAHSLSDVLRRQSKTDPRVPSRASLWLLGQSLALASLIIDAQRNAATDSLLRPGDHPKLLRARDHLLADLTFAPTIAELAKQTGLSERKLKSGFQQIFGNSVYGLFQRERMHEARRRLIVNDSPVMTVAADMGYANASHFAAAFQKEFGVTPSTLRKHR